MTSFLVFSLLFLLPFLIAPFGVTQFETPKVIFAEAGTLVLLLFLVIHQKVSFHAEKIRIILFGLILLLTFIDLFFFRTSISFFGNAFRMQGIFLLWLLLLFSYFSSGISFRNIPWWIFGGLIVAEYIEMIRLPLNASQRYVGTLGEPNAAAAFLVFLWPFLFFSIKKFTKWKIALFILCLAVTIYVFFLTGSRSAMIAFAIQALFIVLYRLKLSIKKSVIICLCFVFASFSLPFFEKDIPYENRLEVWTAGYYAGLTHPMIGNGFGNTEYSLHQAAQLHKLRIRFYYVDSAHNILLDWWVQGGIIGLGVLCSLLFLSFKQFMLRKDPRNIVLLLGILTVLSFNPASVIGLLQFWWLIGQGRE